MNGLDLDHSLDAVLLFGHGRPGRASGHLHGDGYATSHGTLDNGDLFLLLATRDGSVTALYFPPMAYGARDRIEADWLDEQHRAKWQGRAPFEAVAMV